MRAGSFSLVLETVPELPDAQGCDERGDEDAAECGQEESHSEWHGPVGGEVGDLDRLRVLEDEDEKEHEYERGDDDGDPSGGDAGARGRGA